MMVAFLIMAIVVVVVILVIIVMEDFVTVGGWKSKRLAGGWVRDK